MSSGTMVVDQIVEDRIRFLFDLLKDQTIHTVKKDFAEVTGVHIGIENLNRIYQIWYPNRTRHPEVTVRELEKETWWKPLSKMLHEKTAEHVASFIYNHWKKAGNK